MIPDITFRSEVLEYAADTYGTTPEYLWMKTPYTAVLRNSQTSKWYGVIMDIPRNRLGLSGNGFVDVLNVKCQPLMIDSVLLQSGFLPAYHMNKMHWVSILLDGQVNLDTIFRFLDRSFNATDSHKK